MNMKQMAWAIMAVGVLVADSGILAEAAGGRGDGGRRGDAGGMREVLGWTVGGLREILGRVVRGTRGALGGPGTSTAEARGGRGARGSSSGAASDGGDPVGGAHRTGTMSRHPWWSSRRLRSTSRHRRPRHRTTGTTARAQGHTTRTSRIAPAGGCRWCRRRPSRTNSQQNAIRRLRRSRSPMPPSARNVLAGPRRAGFAEA